MQSNTYGKSGEIIASNFLKQKGYKIIATNYKNKIGEIDIIAKDKDTLVFVEVKTRLTRAFGDPFEAINYKKQQKIHKVATLYLIQHKAFEKCDIRFDAVSIVGQEDYEISRIVNAF